MAHDAMSELRRALAAFGQGDACAAPELFSLGAPALDDHLGGGLARGALHEVYTARGTADAAAASGFGLGIALRAGGSYPLLWIGQAVAAEAGRLHGLGVAEFGLDPARLILVRVRDPTSVLRAAAEAARCSALGAVIVEIRGAPAVLDLTASRRLALAARASGRPVLLLRLGAEPSPGAATSRWSVSARASSPLEADAPGHPAFQTRLLRHRAGIPDRTWPLEWNRDLLSFVDPAPLSRAVVPVPRRRPAAADEGGWRRAG